MKKTDDIKENNEHQVAWMRMAAAVHAYAAEHGRQPPLALLAHLVSLSKANTTLRHTPRLCCHRIDRVVLHISDL